MLDEKVLGKLGCGAMTQSSLQKELKCTFGALADAIERLSRSGKIQLRADGSWGHVEHAGDPIVPAKTPPIRFGNSSMPSLTTKDIPRMGSPRSEAPTRQLHLIAMV